ncbi:MAG: hypothetical protein Q7S37_00630 [bacterium]|nr:hypothetical protein [bacterium]
MKVRKIQNKYLIASVIVAFILAFTFFTILTLKSSSVKANYSSITTSGRAQREISAFCQEDSQSAICQKNYPQSIVEEAYRILKKDISDFAGKTNISKIKIMTLEEVTEMCGGGGASSGCWDRDRSEIGYSWDNFTFTREESYQLVAHELLHAYATGLKFDAYPFEEGIVDNLALRLPGIALHGEVDIQDTGTWSYIEMRNIADKVVEILKLKGKGTSQNSIMLNILRGGSKYLESTLGLVETTDYAWTNNDPNNAKCELRSRKVEPVKAANDLTNLTFCLYYDNNYENYYNVTMTLLEKVKQGIKPDSGSGETPNSPDTWSVATYPQLIQEKEKLNIKYQVKNEKAKSLFIALTAPDSTLDLRQNNVCKLINSPDTIGAKNGFYAVFNPACTNGNCQGTYDYVLPTTELTKDYKIKIISFLSNQPSSNSCASNDIISLKQQDVTIEKSTSESIDDFVDEPGKIKGQTRITSPTLIDRGDAVMINVEFTDHKDDELMLWITDCDGTLVPKILMSDHGLRKIPADKYTYHYIWDTKAALTKSCKHTVQVKTFTKDKQNKWKWSDQAKYEINVGEKKADSKMICIMQMVDLKAKKAQEAIEAAKEETTSATINDFDSAVTVEGNQVKLSWNAICSAKKYYVYRNDILIGQTTDTTFSDQVEGEGQYKYRVDAYIEDIPIDASLSGTSGGGDNYDPNLSWNTILKKLLSFHVASISRAVSAPPDPAASKSVVVNVTPNPAGTGGGAIVGSSTCSSGQIQLGVPMPVRDTNGKFTLKYCATDLKEYMQDIYNLLIVIASISAILMIIYGGYTYIASAGDAQKASSAKEIIIGAIIGLILLLSAGLIISTIGVK